MFSAAKDRGFLSVPKRTDPWFGNEHGYQNGLLMYFRSLFLLHVLSYDNFNTKDTVLQTGIRTNFLSKL